tara:strand:+ start:214 stop:753 length:540 start_codon:yes stop_codon:yes gene_type:complete
MPDKNFTQFDNKTQITRNDFVVGYDEAGTDEIRSNVGNIVDLALDAATILIQNEIDRNNIGATGEYVDGDGDYIGEYNDLLFTTSSIQRAITYNGTVFNPGALNLLRGHNYDLSITSTSNNVAIRKNFTDNIEPIDEIFGNDTENGISAKVLWWTPLITGTYYIVDITDITKFNTITIT